MTSHRDVAGFENIEAEIKDRGFDAEMSKNLADIVRISAQAGKDAAASEIERLRAEIESSAKALSEAQTSVVALKQLNESTAVQVSKLVGQKSEWMDRALAAEASLADVKRELTPSGETKSAHIGEYHFENAR